MAKKLADTSAKKANDKSRRHGTAKSLSAGAPKRRISLADRFDLDAEQVFLSGVQAVLRLTLMQKERDRRAGLNTAGYVTGYRGSPVGGIDQQFMRSEQLLKPNDIVFQPGLNEDLAATALWGTQQAQMRGEGKFDGVFGMWYGKGPGVDRSGDVFRHANLAGTAPHGGVIALMGDDHTCESSTTAHQSEFHFVDVMIPVLSPAGVQEILDYGVHGYALSRFAGVWVGIKCVKDTIESTASVDGRVDRVKVRIPTDFAMPKGGLSIRPGEHPLVQEERLQEHKRDAVLAYVRANGINRMVLKGGKKPRLGIITTGKSYLDVEQALADLGIDEKKAADLGIRLFKIGCPWPIPQDQLVDFAKGLDRILVVEEKRSLIEVQVREELYGSPNQPICEGKKDAQGNWLFPIKGALDPNDIAIAIGERLMGYAKDKDIKARVAKLKKLQTHLAETQEVAARLAYFCAGCPHNSSTVVPQGSRAYAGIGCHYMAQWMDRSTEGFTQMGGEGANWIGEAPFSKRGHVFQNLGDGTYNHSGYLAIRAAIAAGVNITYKILYNDAVAMTGGQPHEGALTVPQIAAQVAAEGVKKIVLVSDEPEKYPAGVQWPVGMTIHHRRELNSVQKDLASIDGVTALIYDQTCAAEKRRRRKRGTFPDPAKRVVINDMVCEGCGDCGVKSNCVAVHPLETPFGRKRQIDQSSCNKDFSCVNGFCPSFVTVHGGKLRKPEMMVAGGVDDTVLPDPKPRPLDHIYGVLITGVGGTGVVTIGALLGQAAHIEGLGAGVIDMAGLAQKGGAVMVHVKIAKSPADITAIRVPAGGADLVLGCDLVTTGSKKALAAMAAGRTGVVLNTHETPTGAFTRDADFNLPAERIKRAVHEAAGSDAVWSIDAAAAALAVTGNALASNVFLMGAAFQQGLIPLSAASLEEAIRLNGAAVDANLTAFNWGRRAVVDPEALAALMTPKTPAAADETTDDIIARRIAYLTDYQNAAYAKRYADGVNRVLKAEAAKTPGMDGFGMAVARYLFKLMAIKDEYEVGRLYANGDFQRKIADMFEGPVRLEYHLAPPTLARRNSETGKPEKMRFGGWMQTGFKILAALKGLRGTWADPFRRTDERRMEQKLLNDYEALIEELSRGLTPKNHAIAVELAAIPEEIRGYGHVREAHAATAKQREAALLAAFRGQPAPTALAAE